MPVVNNTPRARMREGSPRIVFATALICARHFPAISNWSSSCSRRALTRRSCLQGQRDDARGRRRTGFINGYSQGTTRERLEVIKLLVDLGDDVNAADDYGITPLMAAANMGEVSIIQYLVDRGADLGRMTWARRMTAPSERASSR